MKKNKKGRKNNSFRKNYRKKSKNYRKKYKISHNNLRKFNKNNHIKMQIGGSQAKNSLPHRIGFELEACFDSEVDTSMRQNRICQGLRGNRRDMLNKIFGGDLNYFDVEVDTTIQCPGPNSSFNVPETPSLCSMELILKNDNIFTYNDKEIYMDDMPITSSLMDEILLISSKAYSCENGSCGFHIHISETDTPENMGINNLNQREGKLFLLRALALWCGPWGVSQSKQDEFIENGYCRPEGALGVVSRVRTGDEPYAAKPLTPLEYEEFKSVYDLAIRDKLTNEKLLDYLKQVYNLSPYRDIKTKDYNFNIYDLEGLIGFDEHVVKKCYLQYIADYCQFDSVDEMNKHIELYEMALSQNLSAARFPDQATMFTKLLRGWEERRASDGRKYFVNHDTQKTQWEDPRKQLPSGWEEWRTSDGRKYFMNHHTQKTQWEDPRMKNTQIEALLKILKDEGISETEKPSDFLFRSERRSRDHLLSSTGEYDRREFYDKWWGRTLRIEFRGHKDLIETINDKAIQSSEGYDISEEAVSMMIDRPLRLEHVSETGLETPRPRDHARAELTRNLAKASRFYDHLIEYLEEINLFFTEAKTFEPFLTS